MKKKVYKAILIAGGQKYPEEKTFDLALYSRKPRIYRQGAHLLITCCGSHLKKIFPGIEKEQPEERKYKRVEVTMKFLD